MPRIKLNRPPPVSSEGATEIVSDKVVDSRVSDIHHVTTRSETGDVSAVNISADVEKCPSDRRPITRKGSVVVEKGARRAVKHRRTLVCGTDKEHDITAAANTVPGLSDVSVASESTAKESKKNQRHGDVTQRATGDDNIDSNYDQHFIDAGTDSSAPGSQNVVSITHRKRKTSKKSNTTQSDSAELFLSRSAGVGSSKDHSHSSFNDDAGLSHSSQETVPSVECQQTGLVLDQKLPCSLLDDVLKGFLVKKLAVIESERKITDVNRKDISVEAVGQNEPKHFPLSAESRRRKRSRGIDDRLRELSYLPAKITDRDKTSHHSNARYIADTHSDRGYMRSHLDSYPHQWHHHPPPHFTHGLTVAENVPKRDFGAEVGHYPHSSPHQGRHHLPQHFVHGLTVAEDVTKLDFGAEVSSFRRGHRSYEHSLHAKRHLSSPDEKNRQMEHRQQSYDLPQLQRNQFSERKIFDCVEQIRNFVTHSQNFSRDHIPLDVYNERSAPIAHGTERRKSGSSSSHHCHHHRHHKKLKRTSKSTSEEKMSRHKCAKRCSGKKGMQKVTKVQEAKLTSKKCMKLKHKHKHHHSKSKLSDVHVDSKIPDMSATLPHVEPKDDDTFNKRRSLSPLGVPIKHRKKHTKKKLDKKTVSPLSAHDASLLPEKGDIPLDNVSWDEEFVPMKVQKNEDGDAIPVNALHKVNEPHTSGVKQGDTKRKSAIGLQNKFLKISGKRPKSRLPVSDANQSMVVPLSSEHGQSGNISVEDHPSQAAEENQLQAVTDTVIDRVPTVETMAPIMPMGDDYAGQMDSSHDVSTLASFTSSEQANSCSSADDGRVLQAVTINADKVSDDIVDEGHTCSTHEVSMASPKSTVAAAGSENLAEASAGDSVLQLGECEHRETVEETNDATKELSTQMDGMSTGKIVSPDKPVTGEELKSYSEARATGEALKSESNALETQSEFHHDIEPDEVREQMCAEEEGKDAEKQSEDLRATLEKSESNTADQHGASCDVIVPAEHSEKPGTEVLATCDTASTEDSSPAETESSAGVVDSHTADQKAVGDPTLVPPTNLIGPPLALPPSIAFKKPLPLKMSLRITNTSASFISSGAKKTDRKARDGENREEGN